MTREMDILEDIADANDQHGNTRARQGRKRGSGFPVGYRSGKTPMNNSSRIIRMLLTKDAKKRKPR